MHTPRASILSAAAILLLVPSAWAIDFTVTSTADTLSPGTLRQAIIDANSTPGDDRIIFDIPNSGIQTIQLLSSLPSITDSVAIDGLTQTDGATAPQIEIDGKNTVNDSGLVVTASNTTIRGLIINDFDGNGIDLQTVTGCVIASNWIGLDADGITPAGNGGDGIYLSVSPQNTIGGASAADGNVIAANGGNGINISDTSSNDNDILNNYIGTVADGTAAAANLTGLLVRGSDNEIRSNVISGTNSDPDLMSLPLIQIGTVSDLGESGNKLYSNKIGTNAAGSASLTDKSTTPGIIIEDSAGNIIGGPGEGNLISGTSLAIRVNGSDGAGQSANDNVIRSNFIGTDITGTQAIPNGGGIILSAETANSVANTTIGGAGDGEGNLISGNDGSGIVISGSFATQNIVKGNLVGTLTDGTTALPNGSDGIVVQRSSGNTIGGTASGEGNVIAFNQGIGVVLFSGTGNRVSGNSIFSNDELGIDIIIPTGESSGVAGVTPNDAGDSDTGTNELQNFPEIESVSVSKDSTRIKGRIPGVPNAVLTLEFFANSSIDPSGFGEGARYLGDVGLTVAANGIGVFDTILTELLSAGESVSAVAIDSSGNTSELSASVKPPQVVKNGAPIAEPPGVVVIDDDATITLQKFQAAKAKRKKNGKRSLQLAAAKRAKRGGARGRSSKATVQYQVTVRNNTTGKVVRRTTKKTVLTLSNLAPGSYSTSYSARAVQGGRVISKTRLSPAAPFTIDSN